MTVYIVNINLKEREINKAGFEKYEKYGDKMWNVGSIPSGLNTKNW